MSSSRIEVRGRARQLLPRAHAPLGAPSTTAPKTESAPITPSLADALAAAERSERRVEQWPAWMRELST